MNFEQIYQDSVALLREMVGIQSLSFEEEKVCAHISEALTRWGIAHRVCEGNIVAVNRLYDPSLPTLALDAHMDTVPAADSYTRDPFDPGNDPEIVWGLGSNDDGASVVSMIAAFRMLYDESMPINLMLCLTREEERSGPDGARWLYAPQGGYFTTEGCPLAAPKWVIVGEPTGLRAATSERGLLVLDGAAHGVTGHAARGEGVNALYIALDDIQKLRGFVFGKHSDTMGDVKLNVTQINAGHAHNVIPELCTFVVDIRPTEQYTNTEIVEALQSVCQSTLTPRNLANRSSATPAGSALLQAVSACGIQTFSSPTTSDWMRIGCEAVKIGPGESSRSHRADEYVLTGEIRKGIETYIKLIKAFYGNIME